ncbi:VOC family protein [Haladaptatus sp. DFWS20]|uniref:VOC family protein n=1 Tax=Haladaptatus sp. DFWS20 TaxID=3403467 RepID=UPI003EC033C6
MIGWKGVDHIQLCISPESENEAREFYGTILGLHDIPKPDSLRSNGGLWFRANGMEVHLGVEDIESPQSKQHPAFEVGNVDETRAHLDASGVETHDETPIPGRERFSFRDPFGNRIEILEAV